MPQTYLILRKTETYDTKCLTDFHLKILLFLSDLTKLEMLSTVVK